MNKSLIALSILSLAIMGCKKEPYIVKSTLNVQQALDVKTDKPEIVRLNAGDYPTSLDINSDRVKATVATATKKSITFRWKLPKNTKLPTDGTLTLTSAQSGQPFDTTIAIKTTIHDSELQRDLEDCTYQDWDQECYVTGNPPRAVCRPVMRTRWGRRTVDFIVRSYNRQFQATLQPGNATQPAATVTGARVDSERIYSRTGACY